MNSLHAGCIFLNFLFRIKFGSALVTGFIDSINWVFSCELVLLFGVLARNGNKNFIFSIFA